MKLQDIGAEYRGASLGDARRGRRLERIAGELARNPGLSFPEAMGSEGQLEGLYRFLNNEQVSFEAVHAPHAQQTRVRCQAHDRVLVLHDTTILTFTSDRQGLGRIHGPGEARGFRVHVSLAVTSAREPLGVLHAETWARTGPTCRDLNRRHIRANPKRESLRWGRAVQTCEAQLGETGRALHVMDREGDNFDLLAELQAAQARYVIRSAHNRALVGERQKLMQVARRAKCLFQREVHISSRATGRPHDHHVARPTRKASSTHTEQGGSSRSISKRSKLGVRSRKDSWRVIRPYASRWRSSFRSPCGYWPYETPHARNRTLSARPCLRGNCDCCALAAPDP
jgi:hypothetical protein